MKLLRGALETHKDLFFHLMKQESEMPEGIVCLMGSTFLHQSFTGGAETSEEPLSLPQVKLVSVNVIDINIPDIARLMGRP